MLVLAAAAAGVCVCVCVCFVSVCLFLCFSTTLDLAALVSKCESLGWISGFFLDW